MEDKEKVILESKNRRGYAYNLIGNKRVLDILKGYGLPLLVGGLAKDVFWSRDIDIVVESKDIRDSSMKFLNKVVEDRLFNKYEYGDFIRYPRDGRPRGYIVNLIHLDSNGNKWEIEVWFLESIEEYRKELKMWKLDTATQIEIIYKKSRRNKKARL